MIHTEIQYVGIATTEQFDEVHLHFVYTPEGLSDTIAMSEIKGIGVHAYC